MKTFITKLLGIILIFNVLLFSSCRDDNPYLTAKINGKDFNSVFRVSYKGNLPAIGESFLITATDGLDITSGAYLTILIRGTEEKEYRLDVELLDGVYQAAAVYKPAGQSDTTSTGKYYGVSGKITLVKVDTKHKKISGTFEFTLKNKNGDVIQITDGKFENLIYTEGILNTSDFDEDNQ